MLQLVYKANDVPLVKVVVTSGVRGHVTTLLDTDATLGNVDKNVFEGFEHFFELRRRQNTLVAEVKYE